MKAAVVESFQHPPRYRDFEEPLAQAGEVVVHVHAAALSQLVRAQAAGKHYAGGKLPFVAGVDGVGILANPGMSSWAALTVRAGLQQGEAVLVNGANGVSGRLAIQIAKYLGASRVLATARNPANETHLRRLGADEFIPLRQSPEALAVRFRQEIDGGIDIVLDYLWGQSAEAFFTALGGHGSGRAEPRIRFVNLGSIAGQSIGLNAGALRSSGIELMGCGLGSLSHIELVEVIARMFAAATAAHFTINAKARPL